MKNMCTIEYDDDQNNKNQETSRKKYPSNKYQDYDQFFNHKKKSMSKTVSINKFQKNKQQSRRKKQQKLNSIKTRCVSTANNSMKIKNKQQLVQQLQSYKQLCLQLRKKNYNLQNSLRQSKINNRITLNQLQNQITKIKQQKMQKYQNKINKQNIKSNKQKQKCVSKSNSKQIVSRGEFKRFFLCFVDQYAKIDDKLDKKMMTKTIQGKLILAQKVLRQSSDYLKGKKFRFNSIYQ